MNESAQAVIEVLSWCLDHGGSTLIWWYTWFYIIQGVFSLLGAVFVGLRVLYE